MLARAVDAGARRFHELAHALTAYWLDCDQDEAHIWPLGSLVGPSYVPRSSEHVLVALAGPLMSGAIFLGAAIGVNVIVGAQFAWNPFGYAVDAGSDPDLRTEWRLRPLSAIWMIGWFGYLNFILMLCNFIPALPFDCGRMFRAYLASTSVVSTRESIAAPWTAHTCAVLLGIIGVARLALFQQYDGLFVIAVAVLVELLVRSESRMLEDGGYFEDGVFGYDFSEGYTSLESAAPKVRPHRESTLKRWRRRRSDLRRQRRMIREAAEEKRMDEILEKLHREGRRRLTDEEHRFLVRVEHPLSQSDQEHVIEPISPGALDPASPRAVLTVTTARPRILDEIDRSTLVLDAGMGTRLIRAGLDLQTTIRHSGA